MHFAVLMIIGGLVGGLVAGNKGRNVLGWTLACGILPLLLPVLFALSVLPRPGISRICPHCLRVIPLPAAVCAYCRRDVPPPDETFCTGCGKRLSDQEKFCPDCGLPQK